MGIIDIVRGRDTTGDLSGETESDTVDDGPGEPTADGRGGRRWLAVLVGIVAVGVVLYLVARRRAARGAEFTEIEFESTASESTSESESASTE